jgi:hypothetical protein
VNDHEDAGGRAGLAPATGLDEAELLDRVRQAWAEVLDVDVVPLDVNFLEAGGSSLLLVMLWEQLQELTAQDLKVSDLFQHGTVRAQARLLGAPAASSQAAAAPAPDRSGLLGRARREATS